MKKQVAAAVGLIAAALVCTTLPASTAEGDPTVAFTAAGDFSAGTNALAVFDKVGDLDRDAHFALGDLSYGVTGQEQSWCDAVTQRVGAGFPFELLAGNHESNGQNGNINDFSACLPNQLPGVVGTYGRQYYVDVPAGAPLVRFVMISPALPFPDGTWSYAAGTPRYQWTAAAIDGARASNIPWVVVGMHKPCLSLGEYSCEPGADLLNLLVSKRVDLVLSGHEHLYQRTKQLAHAPGCTSVTPAVYTAACVADPDADLVKGRGTVMATIGTGGIGLRDVNTADSEAPYFAATSGANQNPTWGVLDVSATPDALTARFERASGGTFADAFTITRSSANTPPVASFTSTCNGLACGFDASGSADPDGTIASYTWDFGDGSTATGATPGHTYATAGTYDVSLTVTDSAGATGTASSPVSVTATPTGTTIARDAFTRTVTNGFGTADVGGPWSISGTPSNFSVSGGVGRVIVPSPSSGGYVRLNGVSSTTTNLQAVLSTNKAPTGGGIFVAATGRRVVNQGEYRAKVRLQAGGSVRLDLVRTNASAVETTIATTTVAGLTYSTGDLLQLRLRVAGTSPTTIQAKVWKVGSAEPTGWQVSTTDATAGLQTAGSIAFFCYLTGSVTNAPVTVTLDDLLVTDL